MSTFTLGKFSGGRSYLSGGRSYLSGGRSFSIAIPGLSSDLCVPLGLVMPDTISFLVEDDREQNAETVPYIGDEKFDDLFFRISYKPPKKNKTRKKGLSN